MINFPYSSTPFDISEPDLRLLLRVPGIVECRQQCIPGLDRLKGQLDQMMKGLDPKLQKGIGDAGKAMDNAQRALSGKDLDNAGNEEKNALDALRKGADALSKWAECQLRLLFSRLNRCGVCATSSYGKFSTTSLPIPPLPPLDDNSVNRKLESLISQRDM